MWFFPLTAAKWNAETVQPSGKAETYRRGRQMQVLLQSNRLSAEASVLVAGIVFWWAQGVMGWMRALPGCLLLAVVALWYSVNNRRYRDCDVAELSSDAVRWRFYTLILAQAIGYGVMSISLYGQMDRDGMFLLTVINAAALPIGAFSVAAVVELGLVWVAPLSVLLTVNLLVRGSTLHYLLAMGCALMGVVSMVSVVSIGRSLQARLRAESDAIEGREALGVLLQDIESQSEDWAWGVDADRRLVHAALPLRQALGEEEGRPVLGKPLAELLAARMGDTGEFRDRQMAAIERGFDAPVPLRNLEISILPATGDGMPAVWSISGVPVHQSDCGRGWRGVIRDVTLVRTQAAELHRLAHTDSLTGLANRHILMQRCGEALERVAPVEGKIPLSLYLVDLDDFKSVNDRLGHITGDLLLQKVARLLQDEVGRQRLAGDAVLARLGGDEFALLVTQAHTAAEREDLGWALAGSLRPVSVSDLQRIDVCASIGIASLRRANTAAESLLREADMALYEAKAAGGNTVLAYQDDMGAKLARRAEITDELGHLLAHHGSHGVEASQVGELRMHYQPQVELDSGQLVGAEALIRWQHPVRGWISPGEFIPLAETTGLIVPLGAWVMERSCREAANWSEPLRVAVNVSGHQLADPQFLPTVRRALLVSRLPAARLEVEITETALMADPEQARSVLLELRRIGVTIALDDFGTGYSSLAYLATLPVDLVKIDRSFVIAMTRDPFVETIVVYILELCRALGVKTLAEGIETPEQAALLLRHGCNFGQGFLYAKGMTAREIVPRRYGPRLDVDRPAVAA